MKAEAENDQRVREQLKKNVFRENFVLAKTPLKVLKQPKDKYKTGQTMLQLSTKFSKDRILQEMIVHE